MESYMKGMKMYKQGKLMELHNTRKIKFFGLKECESNSNFDQTES
jgi:hypothetical protein